MEKEACGWEVWEDVLSLAGDLVTREVPPNTTVGADCTPW